MGSCVILLFREGNMILSHNICIYVDIRLFIREGSINTYPWIMQPCHHKSFNMKSNFSKEDRLSQKSQRENERKNKSVTTCYNKYWCVKLTLFRNNIDTIKILIIWHKYKLVFHMIASRLTHMTFFLKNMPYKIVTF